CQECSPSGSSLRPVRHMLALVASQVHWRAPLRLHWPNRQRHEGCAEAAAHSGVRLRKARCRWCSHHHRLQ
ncbi:unnamed protein product, partial [Closterium sp. Naga37s-1]